MQTSLCALEGPYFGVFWTQSYSYLCSIAQNTTCLASFPNLTGQQELLLNELEKYQRREERNDDVTVIGLKL